MTDSSGGAGDITQLPRRAARAVLARLQQRWREQPVRERTVLFEAFAGAGIRCNPAALFAGMSADPRFRDFEFVWAVSPAAMSLVRPLPGISDPRVRLVPYRSRAYFRFLATAKYLINNVTFPVSFEKRPDQVYVNTWHGTPLKKMGRDVAGADSAVVADTVANFHAADYLLSTCDYMTTTMYRGAYGLDSSYQGRILEVGYPRIDVQFDPADHEATAAGLIRAGVDPRNRQVLVYAPTWKQTSDIDALNDSRALSATMKAIEAALDPVEWLPLLRVHDKVIPYVRQVPELRQFLVPPAVSTNSLLGITDTLVTDYSSVFFDFLATGSRVLFYTPDRNDYARDRGLYFPDDALPGPLTTELKTLTGWVGLSRPDPPDPHATPADARKIFCPNEDGRATERVLAQVFGN